MKAWSSDAAGGPECLVFSEVAAPAAASNQVLVKVLAVGVNYPDALLIRDRYQIKVARPFSPGGEFSGIVEEIGSEVTRLRVGDSIIGRCGWGALVEQIAIDEARCVRVPADMSAVDAAGFLYVYATAYHALRDVAQLRSGETMVVLGAAGGVGSAAVDLGHALGARVIVATSSKDKLDYALSRGGTDGVVYSSRMDDPDAQREFARALKIALGSDGAQVVFDPVGGHYSEPALRSLSVGGRHLVVGFASGISRMPLNLLLLKRCKLMGVDWRSFVASDSAANDRNIESLFALWREGAIRPDISAVYAFEAAAEAISSVERREVVGKLVVQVASDSALADMRSGKRQD